MNVSRAAGAFFARDRSAQTLAVKPEPERLQYRGTALIRPTLTLRGSVSSLAIIAATSVLGVHSAYAQQAAPPVATTTPDAQATSETAPSVSEVVVTGSTSRRTLLNASVAITAVNQVELQQRAPRNTADILETVPGIFVESTAGPVSNNYSVRGLPGGGQQFVRLLEDGMPQIYGGLNDDEVFQFDQSIDHVEAIEGGTSGILAINAAGASINFISRKLNFDEAGGIFKIGGASYGDVRGDLWYSAPLPFLGKGVAFSVSGYIDSNPGTRHSPFNYKTYHFKTQLEKQFDDGGYVRLTYKRWDEHDPYYADQPYSVNNGVIGGVPSLGTQFGSIIGPGFGSITVPDSCAANECYRNFSELQGIHSTGNVYRLDAEKPLGDGISAFAHVRYTQTNWDFNGVFAGSGTGNGGLAPAVDYLTYTPPGPGITPVSPINDFLGQGLAAFPTATQFGIRSLQNGQIIPGSATATLNALNGNGLLEQTVLNHQLIKIRDWGSDFGARWNANGGNWSNSLTLGGMIYAQKLYNDQSGTSTVVNDVKDQSSIYDIVALDAAGGVVGTLSNNGLISYGNWGAGISHTETDSYSLYFNDEFTYANRLHLDAGLRYERINQISFGGNSSPAPVPPGTGGIVQTNPNAFNGTYSVALGHQDPINYTVGANYTISSRLSVYARYAKAYQTNGFNPPTGIALYEAGVTYSNYGLNGSIRGFRTEYSNYNSGGGVIPDNPNFQHGFQADVITNGVDVDAFYRPTFDPLRPFSVHAQFTYQDPKLSNVFLTEIDVNGQNISPQIASYYNGLRPGRTPKILFTITPQYDLPHNWGNLYVRYKYIGQIYADDGDQVSLPAYGILSAGALINVGPRMLLNVSVDNITNQLGLTEGNPRQGFTQQVVNGYFYGRGIIGTNVLASLTYKF